MAQPIEDFIIARLQTDPAAIDRVPQWLSDHLRSLSVQGLSATEERARLILIIREAQLPDATIRRVLEMIEASS